MTVSQRMSETDYTGPFPPVDTMAMIPVILRLVKQTTGLRFSAVARVTADQWVAYAVDDSVRLDIRPGDERVVHETLCNEVRLRRRSLASGAGMRKLANGPYEPENHIPQDRLQSHI
jgi:hypothetical protein